MTRIIAGRFRGRRIEVPAKGTRPTSDRVREAIFSRLDHLGALDGAHVLDLYAGSGALGLEAASRGAVAVTLVDSSRAACAVMARNAKAVGLDARIVAADAVGFTSRLTPDAPFDLVFLDPPYDLPPQKLALVLESLTALLARDAIVVVEQATRNSPPQWPPGLETFEEKTYGETRVYYAEPR